MVQEWPGVALRAVGESFEGYPGDWHVTVYRRVPHVAPASEQLEGSLPRAAAKNEAPGAMIDNPDTIRSLRRSRRP
jgi:hypothetical protein